MQPPLPRSPAHHQELDRSGRRGEFSNSLNQADFLHGRREQRPDKENGEGDARKSDKDDTCTAHSRTEERDRGTGETLKEKKIRRGPDCNAEKGQGKGQQHQEGGKQADEVDDIENEENKKESSCPASPLDGERKEKCLSLSPPSSRRPGVEMTHRKNEEGIYQRYFAAQQAFWEGDFYRAFACLPRQCRQERQLLRSLLSSSSSDASRMRGGDDYQPSRERKGEASDRERDRNQDLLDHDDHSDMEECLEALEMAHASGGVSAPRAISKNDDQDVVLSSSYSPPASAWRDGSPEDLHQDERASPGHLSCSSSSSSAACSSSRTEDRSRDTLGGEVFAGDHACDGEAEGGGERKRRRVLGGARLARKEDVLRAVKSIPKLQRVLFVKAYSAYIWNCCATERIRLYGADAPVPGDLVLCREDGQKHGRLLGQVSGKEQMKASPLSPFRRNGDVVSSLSESDRGEEETGRKKQRQRQAVRVLRTKEDCERWSIKDVVLPLIGVGMKLPENEVGDFLTRLMKEEGLHEGLYRREGKCTHPLVESVSLLYEGPRTD